jgi:hypothetical protein
LYRPLFRQHKFQGSIGIDAFEFTEDYETLLPISTRRNGIYAGGLLYRKLGPGHFLSAGSAMIWFDGNFERVNIWTTPSWGKVEAPEPDMFIATGETYAQAIANQKAMKERFKDDGMSVPREFH